MLGLFVYAVQAHSLPDVRLLFVALCAGALLALSLTRTSAV